MESIIILNLILTIVIIITISVYATYLILKKQSNRKKPVKKEPEPKKITSITQFNGETEEQKKKRLYLESLPPEARALASGKK